MRVNKPSVPVGALLKRLEEIRARRNPALNIWRQCYDVTYPIRGAGFATSLTANNGQAEGYSNVKLPEVYDSTAGDASRVLASGIVSGVTPANSRWFGLQAGNDNDGEKRWLERSSELLWETIHNSNFDSISWECSLDMVLSGQFVMFIPDDPRGFNFVQWPLAKCYFFSSKIGGPIDSLFYEDDWTLENLVNEYGEEALSASMRAAWARCQGDNPTEKRDQLVKIVIAIYPRENGVQRYREARFGYEMPWACCEIEVKEKHVLRERGFMECPIIVPRWQVIPGSSFAIGPMYEALPDAKTVNEVVKLDLMNLDLAVGGMWGGVDDGVLNPSNITLGSRKVIVMRDKDSFFPLRAENDVKAALLEIERLQKSIRRTLMADHLEPQDKPNMTAFEVHVRVELIRQLLGPVYGRLQSEYLQPFIRRCFGIAYRYGLFGRAPRSLTDRILQVHYISPLARAQKLVEVAAMDRYETTLGQESQLQPEILDNYDFDGAARKRSELLGVPQDLIVPLERVREIRESRAKAKAAAAMAQAAAAGGEGMAPAEDVGLGVNPKGIGMLAGVGA